MSSSRTLCFRHLGDHFVRGFIEGKGFLCVSGSLFHHLDLLFNFSNMFISGGSIDF